jgi:hypothetical protein
VCQDPVPPVGARASRGRRYEIALGGVDQHIGVDGGALATFHGVVQGIAVGNVDDRPPLRNFSNAGIFPRFR